MANETSTIEAPEEVKPKRAKRQFVHNSAEDCKKVAEEMRKKRRESVPPKKTGGIKEFKVPARCFGQEFFVVAHSVKDALAKCAMHKGFEAERLDASAEGGGGGRKRPSIDDMLKTIDEAPDQINDSDRERLMAALKKLSGHKPGATTAKK